MAKIGLPKGSGKRLKVREKSVKSQRILKWILSGNPVYVSFHYFLVCTFLAKIIHMLQYFLQQKYKSGPQFWTKRPARQCR